jgi:single-stranded-DNA-specific exonuclease
MVKIWKIKDKVAEDVVEKIIGGISANLHPRLAEDGESRRAGPLPSAFAEAMVDKEGEGGKVLLAQMLFNRGLTEKDQIADFLEPKYENLNSPFLFQDMEKAVERIWEAIDKNQKICIYGDYDADAITANAVLGQTFKHLGVEVSSYIPDRFTEGYGVNIEALQKIKDQGAKIIITVDCGTNSVDAAEFCSQNDIDFIITDHHEVIGELPKAYALINPKNDKDGYPYHEITGVGVAFKLACGILSKSEKCKVKSEKYVDGYEKWLLDLVAIGTVADCHSLMGENRILVKYGLKVLAKTKWVGLRALMQSSGLIEGSPLGERGTLSGASKVLDTYSLGFVIAPRLNAAGRLEHAGIAVDLLLETDANLAKAKAQNLETINTRRQNLTASIMSEAKEKVLLLKERKVLALVGEGWPKGIMGLVAGKLAEEFYKPTIVLERTDELCTGSARTAGEFDILEALKFSSEHLSKFGGHKQAAGLSLKADQFELFYQKLLVYADSNINEEKSQKILELEAELKPEDLKLETLNLITLLRPFGVDNVAPKFLISNLQILSTRLVGKQSQHLQIKFKIPRNGVILNSSASEGEESQSRDEILRSAALPQDDAVGRGGGREISGIMFNAPDFAKNLKIRDTVDVAGELIEDNWNGREGVKLRVIDIKQI